MSLARTLFDMDCAEKGKSAVKEFWWRLEALIHKSRGQDKAGTRSVLAK